MKRDQVEHYLLWFTLFVVFVVSYNIGLYIWAILMFALMGVDGKMDVPFGRELLMIGRGVFGGLAALCVFCLFKRTRYKTSLLIRILVFSLVLTAMLFYSIR